MNSMAFCESGNKELTAFAETDGILLRMGLQNTIGIQAKEVNAEKSASVTP